MHVYYSVYIMYQASWLNAFSRTLKTEITKVKLMAFSDASHQLEIVYMRKVNIVFYFKGRETTVLKSYLCNPPTKLKTFLKISLRSPVYHLLCQICSFSTQLNLSPSKGILMPLFLGLAYPPRRKTQKTLKENLYQ